MKKIKMLLTAALLLMCILNTCTAGCESPTPAGDFLYMINVCKGDSILLRVSGKYYLIDAAKSKYWDRLEEAFSEFGVTELEGVFLTHTDKDHSGGLKKLVKSGVRVNNWYASAFYVDEESEHPLVKALSKTDAKINFLKAGDSVDGLLRVLAPSAPDIIDEDNNSLVMLLDNGFCRVLLTGDMEREEESLLVSSGAKLNCDVFKVPNHCDDDVCRFLDLKALGAKVALISTDPYDKPGTPDPFVLEMLADAGMEVYRTDYAEKGILVLLDGSGRVTVR